MKFVGWRNDCVKVFYVNKNGTIISADLGSSSNYSNELQSIKSVVVVLHTVRLMTRVKL